MQYFKYIFLINFFSFSLFSDNFRVANIISYSDLNKPCPGKYMEWFAMSSNQDEWGAAQIKIFFLVDKEFLKRAANSGISPQTWGKQLGQNFRYFCEKSPTVSVRKAALQTINYMDG